MDTAALKASWANVVAAGDDVPLYFYSHLFLSHPGAFDVPDSDVGAARQAGGRPGRCRLKR